MIGTYVNTGTILGGSLIGLVIGKHLPERLKTTVMQGLGLSTLLIGMQMALSGHSPISESHPNSDRQFYPGGALRDCLVALFSQMIGNSTIASALLHLVRNRFHPFALPC